MRRRIRSVTGPEIVFHHLDQALIESFVGGWKGDVEDIDDPIAAGEQHLLIIDGLTAIAGEHEPAFACGEGYGRGRGKVSARCGLGNATAGDWG